MKNLLFSIFVLLFGVDDFKAQKTTHLKKSIVIKFDKIWDIGPVAVFDTSLVLYDETGNENYVDFTSIIPKPITDTFNLSDLCIDISDSMTAKYSDFLKDSFLVDLLFVIPELAEYLTIETTDNEAEKTSTKIKNKANLENKQLHKKKNLKDMIKAKSIIDEYGTFFQNRNRSDKENTQNFTTKIAADSKEINLKLSPNPSKDKISISFNSKTKKMFDIVITDMTGKSYFCDKKESFSGNYSKTINTNKWHKGNYLLVIDDDTNRYSKIISKV